MTYFFSGFCAVIMNFLIRLFINIPNIVSVGASGAILGMLAAAAILFPKMIVFVFGIFPM